MQCISHCAYSSISLITLQEDQRGFFLEGPSFAAIGNNPLADAADRPLMLRLRDNEIHFSFTPSKIHRVSRIGRVVADHEIESSSLVLSHLEESPCSRQALFHRVGIESRR